MPGFVGKSPQPIFPMSIPFPFQSVAIALALLALAGSNFAQEEKEKTFPKTSPEHQALTASSPYLGNDKFTLRNDYWKGALSTDNGTAIRLQFFKGNTYRFFLGADTTALPAGAKLHLHIFDTKEKEVATSSGQAGQPSVALHLEKVRKTDSYLILMRVEPQAGPAAVVKVPAALFYGWE